MSSETNSDNFTDPVKLWKDWNETTTRMWPGTFDSGKKAYKDPFGFYAFWVEPVTFFKQWCDATGEMWMRMVGVMMNPQQLQAAHYQFIKAYASVIGETFHLINKAMFQNIPIHTYSDISQLAKLVASLEERVYTLEDAFVTFEDRDLSMATEQMVKGPVGDLEQVEGKQDILNTRSSVLEQAKMIGDLAGHLKRIEGKMDMLLAAFEKIETRSYSESVWSANEGAEYDKTQKERGGTQ